MFISYASADVEHARRLATSLGAAGVRAFLLLWVEPGVVESTAQEDALSTSSHGILIFSRKTMGTPAIRDEYAALLRLARSRTGRRFIPVLVEDVAAEDLPPFAAIRRPLDLRDAGDGDYDARVAPLLSVLGRTGGPAGSFESGGSAGNATDAGVADVVIVTALREELDAVLAALGKVDVHRRAGRDSYLADVGGLRVAVVGQSGMGNVAASVAAQQAIQAWRPTKLMLVGIAGGFAGTTHDVRLGDVLVPDQVVGFELAKVTPHGPRRRYESYRPDYQLLSAAKCVAPQEWAPTVVAARPSDPAGEARAPEVHFAAVLSGEKVFAHGASVEELRRHWPHAIGVEMESLGVALAAYRGGGGFLMVKGVSDLADEAKDDQWRRYAAHVAAQFAIAVLRRQPIEP